MTSILEAIQKGQKKAAKSKKCMKHAYDSSSNSNTEQESQSGDTGLGRDKHLKLDKPIRIDLVSTTPHLIKVTIAKIRKNTGKLTAAVVLMTVFCRKKVAQC